ncbi:MAG TPA: lysophospholipid acyltransferase family protein [Gemmatimonadaceae bacterium]|nr:lysophospholipid acyltransferase family protein [Gemmatimonadaceae bacterium]
MLYVTLRAIARLALRWFYRDIEVSGLDHLGHDGPVLLAGNHANSLVDALVIGVVVPRRITITAKATLLDNVFTRAVVKAVGIVPLRRASDEQRAGAEAAGATGRRVDPRRNESSFEQVLDVLAEGGTVLVFPEGRSHDEPALSPLKTGMARMALRARDERGLESLRVVPVGITYEAKERPRSRVAVQVGEAIVADGGFANDASGIEQLTATIDAGLHDVTLNFPSVEDAERVWTAARLLSGIFTDIPRPLGSADAPLVELLAAARRVDLGRSRTDGLRDEVATRVRAFTERLDAFREVVRSRALAVDDLGMSLEFGPAAWFTIREGVLAALVTPIALWGRLNHWIPLRLARWVALRRSRSLNERAMIAIVAGLALVLLFYFVQVALVWRIGGATLALVYLVSLPISATWDIVYADRRRRAWKRLRTWLALRNDPALRRALLDDASWLRDEAGALDRIVNGAPAERSLPSAP